MIDNDPRHKKVGSALSNLGNVLFLPRSWETSSNESISGRSHRLGWRSEFYIDLLFLIVTGEVDHCFNAYMKDYRYSVSFLKQHYIRYGENSVRNSNGRREP